MLKPRQMIMKKVLVANSNTCLIITPVFPEVTTVTGVPSGGTPSVEKGIVLITGNNSLMFNLAK